MKTKGNDTYPTHDIPAINIEGTNFLQSNGKQKGGGGWKEWKLYQIEKIKQQKQPTNKNNNGNNTIENYN